MHVRKETTYSFPNGNNGFAMSLCFIAFAKDLFFYSWAEIVSLRNSYMNGQVWTVLSDWDNCICKEDLRSVEGTTVSRSADIGSATSAEASYCSQGFFGGGA
jgi:hypothetical protein